MVASKLHFNQLSCLKVRHMISDLTVDTKDHLFFIGKLAAVIGLFLFGLVGKVEAQFVTKSEITLCTMTLNSSDEKEAFESYKRRFGDQNLKIVELTNMKNIKNSKSSDNWFENACDSKIQCDALLISAHFAGSFSGKKVNQFINISDLEKRSCQASCSGILTHPQQVYIMACNALSTKDKDSREQEYSNLIESHVQTSPDESNAVYNDRYGSLGYSYRDRFENIFSNAKIIVGFDSTSPLGPYIAPQLTDFLNAVHANYGTYTNYLLQQKRNRISVSEELKTNEIMWRKLTEKNPHIVFADGILSKSEKTGSNFRKLYCGLFDESVRIDRRLEKVVLPMLTSDAKQIRQNLPSVVGFLRSVKHAKDFDKNECPWMQKLNQSLLLQNTLLDYFQSREGQKENLYNLEVYYFAYRLGFLEKEIIRSRFQSTVAKLLIRRNITQDAVETVCSVATDLQESFIHFKPNLISTHLFKSENGIRLVGCARINSDSVLKRLESIKRNGTSSFKAEAEKAIRLLVQFQNPRIESVSELCPIPN